VSEAVTPTTYVVLLRGINVGGRNKVPMARLKAVFEGLGFSQVRTYIASGNVIFRPPTRRPAQLADEIETALEREFGFHINVVLRDLETIVALVQALPAGWNDDKAMKCDVMFFSDPLDGPELIGQLPADPEIEDVVYLPGAVVWRVDRDKARRSRMFKLIGTELHKQMTARNPSTVRKLRELMLEAAQD
jgi:uncharacterized protein (DUF1697 family)